MTYTETLTDDAAAMDAMLARDPRAILHSASIRLAAREELLEDLLDNDGHPDARAMNILGALESLLGQMEQVSPKKLTPPMVTYATASGTNRYWLEEQPTISARLSNGHLLVNVDGLALKYSGKWLPRIGQRVNITMNGIGFARVTGYFFEEGWLGILATIEAPPAWWTRQRRQRLEEKGTDGPLGNHAAVFGAEIEG